MDTLYVNIYRPGKLIILQPDATQKQDRMCTAVYEDVAGEKHVIKEFPEKVLENITLMEEFVSTVNTWIDNLEKEKREQKIRRIAFRRKNKLGYHWNSK